MSKLQIEYMHFSDAANTDSSGKVSILGIFDKFLLKSVPSKYPRFTIVLKLSFKGLGGLKNELEIKIIRPDNKELEKKPPIKLEFSIDEKKSSKSGNINLILDINNLEFDSYGEYKFVLLFNGNEIHSKKVLVDKIKGN